MRMATFADSTFLVFYISTQVLSVAWPCPPRCQCPEEPPPCPRGVPLVLDDCACCLVCARQGGEPCSDTHPCDARRGLRCDRHANGDGRTGVCVAQQGEVCRLDGSVYQSGETFFPSCRYQCTCRDGHVGCVPRCHLDVMLPGPDCPAPRRVLLPGECCEKWLCEPQAEASALGGLAMAAYRQEATVSFEAWDPSLNCIEQTTEWGACSQSCGMGVSTRVTNKNARCEMVKQTRLCIVRTCDPEKNQLLISPPKRVGRCQRIARSVTATHLSYKNCTSIQAYRPRYCGSCDDGRCCTPHSTRTALVDFQCEDGKTTRKPVMVIQSCACHHHCPIDNAVYQSSNRGYSETRM